MNAMRDATLRLFLDAPDGQFDEDAKPRVEELIGLSDEDLLKPMVFLMDDCVYFSWTSGFALRTLNFLFEEAGGNPEFVVSLADEREQRFKDREHES